ncbi:MAG: hypothetical protein Q4D90_03385 [bacterium]|nr:hypothetical protein [bacterium]
MKKMEKDRETDAVEQKIKEAFGFDEEQLLREFHMAEKAISDEELPETPADDFKRLLARIDADKHANHGRYPENIENLYSNHKKKRMIVRMRRATVLVAALAIATLGISIVGVGGKTYYFREKARDSIRNDIVFNNDEVLEKVSDEEKAYKEIEKAFQVDALKLGDRPEDLEFSKLDIGTYQSILSFTTSEEQFLYVYQTNAKTGHSYNAMYDGKEIGTCKNEWLNQEFPILLYESDTGWEYTVKFTHENNYFIVEANNLSLDDFMLIVSDLHF